MRPSSTSAKDRQWNRVSPWLTRTRAATRGPDGLTLTLPSGYAFQGGAAGPDALPGVLEVAGRFYEVAAAKGPLPAGVAGLGPPQAKLASTAQGAGLGLPLAVVHKLLSL